LFKFLLLYMNENVPKSIRKGNIEEKLKEKEKELKQINSIIYELKNKEKIEKLREKKINSLNGFLKSLKLGISKLSDIDWKNIITRFIDKIEVDSEGRMTDTAKLDIYIHYNFNELVAGNIDKIRHCWANGGIGRRASFSNMIQKTEQISFIVSSRL
jgi:hypothetical protein